MVFQGIEKVSFVDWEGKICATLFTGTCNFRCPFCHNAKVVENEYEQIQEEEVLSYLKERGKLLDGVVISGGEPTLQYDLENFARKVKALGLPIKLDTNGTNPAILKRLLDEQLVDFVAMDVKNSFEDYIPITATTKNFSSLVKESLQILRESGVEYELRITLVKEFHNKSNIEKLAYDLAGEGVLFLQKFVANENCFNSNLTAVPKEEATKFQNILQKTVQKVILRGY